MMFRLSRREHRPIPLATANDSLTVHGDILTRRYAGKRPCRRSRRAVMASGMLGINHHRFQLDLLPRVIT
eukprot:scaffold4478_cov107-Skeletonema_dohrnii-CCMP3373.AAC.3